MTHTELVALLQPGLPVRVTGTLPFRRKNKQGEIETIHAVTWLNGRREVLLVSAELFEQLKDLPERTGGGR